MYRVMFAEDEQEVLAAILSTIKWEEHGFEPPVGCRDGREAIAALEDGFSPDALIADICMPFVDGLELTRYVGEHNPNTVVVILTGYDDFKYAQKAIKLQVFDYVLKPITPNCINELLDKIRAELDARSRRGADDAMKIAASYFLDRLVTKKLDPVQIEENCKRHGLSFPGRYQIAAVLDLDLPTPSDVEESNNLELMRYGLYNVAQELAEAREGTMVFQGKDGVTKLVLGAPDIGEAYAATGNLTRLIARTVRECLKISVSGGIGEPVAYLDELHLSHAQAMAALSYRFFYGEESIICEADIDIKEAAEIDYMSYERRFEAAVKAFDPAGASDAVAELSAQLRESRVAFDRCVLYCQKLMMTLITLTGNIVGEQEVATLEKGWEQLNFYAASTLGQLESMVLELCGKAFEMFEMVRNDSASAQVVKAENYIKENFRDSKLSLNSITEHLAISTSYFSAIFKSRTGSTFVEYLTRVRMEKAKQILSFTDRRTYEAAEDVGFSDPHYFSVAFKRVTGMTPKEYREYSKSQAARTDAERGATV